MIHNSNIQIGRFGAGLDKPFAGRDFIPHEHSESFISPGGVFNSNLF
jgi:hypothetical protein